MHPKYPSSIEPHRRQEGGTRVITRDLREKKNEGSEVLALPLFTFNEYQTFCSLISSAPWNNSRRRQGPGLPAQVK